VSNTKYISGTTYIRQSAVNVPPGIRHGVPAYVIAKEVMVTTPGGSETECYLLQYEDGKQAHIPVSRVEEGELNTSSE
jgi:hypothetical protein